MRIQQTKGTSGDYAQGTSKGGVRGEGVWVVAFEGKDRRTENVHGNPISIDSIGSCDEGA